MPPHYVKERETVLGEAAADCVPIMHQCLLDSSGHWGERRGGGEASVDSALFCNDGGLEAPQDGL